MLLHKKYQTYGLLSLLSFIMISSVVAIGYFIPDRANIYSLWIAIGSAFIAYFFIINEFREKSFQKINYTLAVVLRVVLLASFPLLSDDVYRFIWDGSQLLHGINPFAFTPTELMAFNYDWTDTNLFDQMNSPNYYSVYPPINQLAFLLSAIPGKGNLLYSIVILRGIILLFDLGNIYLIKKLLSHFKKNENFVFLYALNPLVIIELTGNLHFEVAMIFFTLLSVWLLLKHKWILASIALGLAVCTKLLPLIFLPLFIKHIGFRKTIYAAMIVGITVAVLFLPLIYNIELAENLMSSLRLYYGNFEFNGSVYNLLREVGWAIFGYNPIRYISIILIILTLTGFMWVYVKSRNMLEGVFWLIFVYNIFGAVVHPWYILILISLTPFLHWRFSILWSLLICLTYYTYSAIPYKESSFLLLVEYGILVMALAYEYLKPRQLKEKIG